MEDADEEFDTTSMAEEVAICEGGTNPLENNRTGELAMECWNLRKTIMEQSAQVIKMKKEMKSQKNLVKNLQKCVSELEGESLNKTKDIHAKKTTILQLEKKIHEITTTNSFVNSSFNRNKKMTASLNKQIEQLQQENNLLDEKFATTTASMKDEMASQESSLCLEIRKLSEERDRLAKDLAVQQTYLDESVVRINDLDASSRELKTELETQTARYSENLTQLAREQEHSYDQLHARLETIWGERDAFCRRLVEKEHENHQLMSFILMEGLQLPELLPPSKAIFDAVHDKYPAGSSTLIEGVPLLGGNLLASGDGDGDGTADDGDDYDDGF